MPVATLTAPCPTKDKNVPTFSGTGPAGATLASGQLSNRLSTATAPKIAQETQKLHVRGDTIKCSIVSGEVTVNGEIRFEGKSKSSAPQPRVVPNVGAEADAAVTVDGSLKLTMVCESLSTNSITFGGDDDDDF